MAKVKKDYVPRDGSRVTKTKARIYGRALDEIGAKHDGMLTAELVVKEARRATSPLHEWFDWNDSSAAAKFRLAQARDLISSIRIVVQEDKTGATFEVPSRVVVTGGDGRKYMPIERMAEDVEYAAQIIAQAKSDLKAWRARYNNLRKYAELTGVFEVIDEVA